MWIKELRLIGIKGFADSDEISLSRGINVFIGPNNSGKSTIVRSPLCLQDLTKVDSPPIHADLKKGEISFRFQDCSTEFPLSGDSNKFQTLMTEGGTFKINLPLASQAPPLELLDSTGRVIERQNFLPSREPHAFVYPYLSRRKVHAFSDAVTQEQTRHISGTLENLTAKIDRIGNRQYPGNRTFERACKSVLGFRITTFASPNGKQVGLIVDNENFIPLASMGEGVANVLGLLVLLCEAKNRVFVIEEIENDIHPRALKKLLELIAAMSVNNQFLISTHSNIVAKYLGAAEASRLFKVECFFKKKVPKCQCSLISNEPSERRELLEELGYELTDVDLWEAWLILEESSAERLVRDFFLPWFAPRLVGKLRTISTRGIDSVEVAFEDFHRLFLFTHLAGIYKNRSWVVVDGGKKGEALIQKLRRKYCNGGAWKNDNFIYTDKEDFERYYPPEFKNKVEEVLRMPHGRSKQDAKAALLKEVEVWISNNEDSAKLHFTEHASIWSKLLRTIQDEIFPNLNVKGTAENARELVQ